MSQRLSPISLMSGGRRMLVTVVVLLMPRFARRRSVCRC
jgi:hypothetical protein